MAARNSTGASASGKASKAQAKRATPTPPKSISDAALRIQLGRRFTWREADAVASWASGCMTKRQWGALAGIAFELIAMQREDGGEHAE